MKVKGNPLISVIIPVYNVEKYLSACLDSVCNQTYKNLEIICVNDGSTDSSDEILAKYKEKFNYIKVIFEKNSGLACARNLGIREAQGEYIIFVDSDDYLLRRDALAWVGEEIREGEIDVLCYNGEPIFDIEFDTAEIMRVRNWMARKREYGFFLHGYDLYDAFMKNNDYITAAWLLCVRREFLIKNNIYFPPGRIHEDVLFSIYVLLLGRKVKHINKSIYAYRQRSDSIVRSEVRLKRVVDSILNIIDLKEQKESLDLPAHIVETLDRHAEQISDYVLNIYKQVTNFDEEYRLLPTERKYILRQFLNNRLKDKYEKFLFPFHMFRPGAKVVIYGAGDVGTAFVHQVKKYNYVELVGVIDNNRKKSPNGEFEIYKEKELIQWNYDYILIAVKDKNVCEDIKERIKNIGIGSQRIVWCGDIYSREDFYNRYYLNRLKKEYTYI